MKLLIKTLIFFIIYAHINIVYADSATQREQYNNENLNFKLHLTSPGIQGARQGVVRLRFKSHGSSSCFKERSVTCMGGMHSANEIYTAGHCIYPTNIFVSSKGKQISVTVIDPADEDNFMTYQAESVIVDTKFKNSIWKYASLGRFNFVKSEFTTIKLPFPVRTNIGRPMEVKTSIDAEKITKLLSCDPMFVELGLLAPDISAKCKSPTLSIVFGSPLNDGWFKKNQNKAEIRTADFDQTTKGYALSFGLANSYNDKTRNPFFDYPNPTNSLPGIYGIFFNKEAILNNYFYSYAPKTREAYFTVKNFLTDYTKQLIAGDSGAPIIVCDNNEILSNEQLCYYVGIATSSGIGCKSCSIGLISDEAVAFIDK